MKTQISEVFDRDSGHHMGYIVPVIVKVEAGDFEEKVWFGWSGYPETFFKTNADFSEDRVKIVPCDFPSSQVLKTAQDIQLNTEVENENKNICR